MQIKNTEGQTVLTLVRLVIVIFVCLCVGKIGSAAQGMAELALNAEQIASDMVAQEEYVPSAEGQKTILYYSLPESHGSSRIYQIFYKNGTEGAYGLTDSLGRQLLPPQYEDILVLPQAYLLKQDGLWGFFDRSSLESLSDRSWNSVQLQQREDGFLLSDSVLVGNNDKYGICDMLGQVIIEPLYDSMTMSSQVDWPLIRVCRDGRYGYIDSNGDVIVRPIYDYAVMDTVTVYADENDAEGTLTPLIYVLSNGSWGAIYRQGDAATNVDWSVEPSADVLAAYEESV